MQDNRSKDRYNELVAFCNRYGRLPKSTLPDEQSLRLWAYENCKRPEVLKIYLSYRQLNGRIAKGKKKL